MPSCSSSCRQCRWPGGGAGPFAVFFAVGIPRAVYDQLNLNFAITFGPAIAYYTIMDRSSTRVRVAISALLLYGVVRSQMLPGHNEPAL